MKKTILSAALAVFAVGAQAEHKPFDYVSAGIIDGGSSELYIAGSKQLNDQFVVDLEFIDIGDYMLTLQVKYLMDSVTPGFYLNAGVETAKWGSFDETGAVAGAGYVLPVNSELNVHFDANYHTFGDGYTSIGARAFYHFTDSISTDVGFTVNTSGYENLLRLGVAYKF
jgi:hypothetical protein